MKTRTVQIVLNAPGATRWHDTNIGEVAVYHLKNIELIRKLGRLFAPVGAVRVEQLISQLKE